MQITVLRFNSNDDRVILTKWLVKPGDYVEKGQVIACFETSKADIEYEAEEEGVIFPSVNEKTEVSVGDMIGKIENITPLNAKSPYWNNKIAVITDAEKKLMPWLTLESVADKKIGQNVTINGKITAKHLEIGDNTVINDCRIEADTVVIGKNCLIGNGNDFSAHKILIGDNFRTAQNVKIDVSGGITKKSTFGAGDDCLLCMDVYVNCCREVILGDRVCLSPRSMVFTHRYWQDVRKGYDSAFNSVVLKNDSWLGANAVVMPGVIVGAGSIIMAGSTVTDNVPERTMIGGIPAVKIKQIPDRDNFDLKKFGEFVKLREEYLGKEIVQDSGEYRECLRRFGIREDL